MQYAISILIALLSTVIFYGAPSLLLLKFRKRPIKIRDFRIFCILSTVCVWALFRVIFNLLGMEDSAHGSPAILWGTVFYNYVIARLHKSGRIYETMPAFSNIQSGTASESAKVEDSYPSSTYPDTTESSHIKLIKKRKFETFYTCPSCGCLVPKGTYTCECGYAFRKRFEWKIAALSLLVLLCISLSFSIWSYQKYNSGLYHQKIMNDQLQLLKREYQDKRSEAESMSEEIRSLKDDNVMLTNKSDFIDENVVFVPVSGHLYHKFDCHFFTNANEYYVFNVEYAIAQGYKPCPECNPPQR